MLRFVLAVALGISVLGHGHEVQDADKSTGATPVKADAAVDSLAEATQLSRDGQFEMAIKKYQEVLAKSPNSSAAYAGLIRVYLKQRDVQQASDTIAKAIQAADGPALRVALGEVYFRQGKLSEAEHEWIAVLNSGHADARAYLGLARIARAYSMYKRAKEKIEKARALDGADPDVEGFWLDTLSRSDRIQYLESALATTSKEDTKTREDLQHYLDYLKARQQDPQRNCRLVGDASSTETDLVPMSDPYQLRGMGLSVSVNGAKANLLLDTGASGILVDRGMAEKAGLTKLTETSIWGFGDKRVNAGWVGVASSIKIGRLEFQNCPVSVIDKRSVAEENGLIGTDVFEQFLVDIDFPARKFRLSELPKRPGETDEVMKLVSNPAADTDATGGQTADGSKTASTSSGPLDAYTAPEMKSYTKVFRFGHQLLIPTRIGNSPPKFFVIDTGAFSNMIDPSAAREVTKVHGDQNTVVKGVSGSVKKVYSADKAVLVFGHLHQENQDVVSFDMSRLSDGIGTEISGTLGFRMLNLFEVKIDYRDGLVDFLYDPNRAHY